jgi:homoserine O-succinyltransferase
VADHRPPLRVALVNIMPDAAFEETDRQFTHLLGAGPATPRHTLARYTMPDLERGEAIRDVIARDYEPMHRLFEEPPDALILTGTEPRCADLRDERHWEGMRELIFWAPTAVSSVLLSCLASHAALLALHDVARVRLDRKYSGVYVQQTDEINWVAQAIGPAAFPHSRLNDVPIAVMEELGYSVLLGAPDIGWTIAARESGCLWVLLQGHPEYSGLTLLKEYRRDVRRFLEKSRPEFPDIPSNYLGAEATRLLLAFKDSALRHPPDPAIMEHFPFQAAARGIVAEWQRPAQGLFAAWLGQVSRRNVRVG